MQSAGLGRSCAQRCRAPSGLKCPKGGHGVTSWSRISSITPMVLDVLARGSHHPLAPPRWPADEEPPGQHRPARFDDGGVDSSAAQLAARGPRGRQRCAPRVCCRFALPTHPSTPSGVRRALALGLDSLGLTFMWQAQAAHRGRNFSWLAPTSPPSRRV